MPSERMQFQRFIMKEKLFIRKLYNFWTFKKNYIRKVFLYHFTFIDKTYKNKLTQLKITNSPWIRSPLRDALSVADVAPSQQFILLAGLDRFGVLVPGAGFAAPAPVGFLCLHEGRFIRMMLRAHSVSSL